MTMTSMSVTVLFSPSLRTTCVSCTRRLADDVTVLSFISRLRRDFNVRKCVEELELHFIPASSLWMGGVGIGTPSCQLEGSDRLWPLVEKNFGRVLYLMERREEEAKVKGNKEMDSVREGGKSGGTEVEGNNHSLKEGIQLHNLTRQLNKEIDVNIGKEIVDVNILQGNAMSSAVPNSKGNNVRDEQLLVLKKTEVMSPLPARHPKQSLLKVSPPQASCVSEVTAERSVCSARETSSRERLLWVSDTDSESESKFMRPSECLPGLKRLTTGLHNKSCSLLQPPSLTITKQNTPPPVPKSNRNRPSTDVIILSSSEEAEILITEESRAMCGKEREMEVKVPEEDSAVNLTVDSITLSSSPLHNPLPFSVWDTVATNGMTSGLLRVDGPRLEEGVREGEVRGVKEGDVRGVREVGEGWDVRGVREVGEVRGVREGDVRGVREVREVRGVKEVGDGWDVRGVKEVGEVREMGEEDEGIVMDVGVESDSGDGGSVIVVESGDEGREWLHHRLRHSGNQFSERIHCCGMELNRKDLATLLPNQCLNDQVINCYMKLLMKNTSSKKVFIANSFFYTKLSRSGHKGVQRWMKDVDFSVLDLFVVPVHLPVHWCLVAVHIKKKLIEYYDSLGGRNSSCMKRVLRFVLHRIQRSSKFWAFKKKYRFSSALKPRHWRKCYPKELPRQLGSVDCGVFVCQYARWLCNNPGRLHSSIPFTQSHMHRLRRVMIQELESGHLMPLIKF